MKKQSFIKKIASVAILALTVIACQSDDANVESSLNPEAKIHFATDHAGKIAENIPPEILKLMLKKFQDSGDSEKAVMLKSTYDFKTGGLTVAAKTSETYATLKSEKTSSLENSIESAYFSSYRAHVGGLGWLPWTPAGQIIGTTGQGRQLEAIEFDYIPSPICTFGSAHVKNLGWFQDGCSRTLGTTGLGLRMEAIKLSAGNDYYRAYVQNIGWLPWVTSGQVAGTVGQGRRMEAFQYSQYNF